MTAPLDPLEKRVVVRCSMAHAFETFTDHIDQWWPQSHRRFDDSVMTLEPKIDGRFNERAADGSEADLGVVRVWLPPVQLVYSWNPGSVTGPTEVEVLFSDLGDATQVDVIHRVGQAADVFADRVSLFNRAWTSVLHSFAAAVSSS